MVKNPPANSGDARVLVQPLSRVQLFETPWTAACQSSLSSTISWSLLKFMSIKSVMLANALRLCYPLLLLPSIFPSIRVFSNESALGNKWPKYRSFSISLSNEYQGWFPLGDAGSIPGLGRPPGEGNGNPLQYSCLKKCHGQRSLAGYSWASMNTHVLVSEDKVEILLVIFLLLTSD